jgi:hypothetical protein
MKGMQKKAENMRATPIFVGINIIKVSPLGRKGTQRIPEWGDLHD